MYIAIIISDGFYVVSCCNDPPCGILQPTEGSPWELVMSLQARS